MGNSTIIRRYTSIFLIIDPQDLRKILRTLQFQRKKNIRKMFVNFRIEAFWDMTSCQLLVTYVSEERITSMFRV